MFFKLYNNEITIFVSWHEKINPFLTETSDSCIITNITPCFRT